MKKIFEKVLAALHDGKIDVYSYDSSELFDIREVAILIPRLSVSYKKMDLDEMGDNDLVTHTRMQFNTQFSCIKTQCYWSVTVSLLGFGFSTYHQWSY